MKENYSILLMGKLYNAHMDRFVRNLKLINPKANFDCFGQKVEGQEMSNDYKSCFRECHIVEFSENFYHVPGLRTLEIIHNWRKHFKSFAKGRHYDIVNIHFPTYTLRYIIDDLKLIADNIVLFPWGSDVYRISSRARQELSKVYSAADYILATDRFANDCKLFFSIPDEKIIEGRIGSESIDYILENYDKQSTIESKKLLGIENNYVISCGYNASPEQHHLEMIKAIASIKDSLPTQLVLLFPVTYPKNPVYVDKLKASASQYGLKSVFFDNYLEIKDLFTIRQASDMFIHIQTTDANNASLKEYVLLNKNCINGAWLRYPDIEEEGYTPYYLVHNIEDLSDVVLDAYKNGAIPLRERSKQSIENLGSKICAKNINDFFMRISH